MTHCHIALPLLNEEENLANIVECFRQQEGVSLTLWCCVNQPDSWWEDPDKRILCEANLTTLRRLEAIQDLSVRLIDRSSKGVGWPDKKGGIGWARKILMDTIAEAAEPEDLIVSVDADSHYPPTYCQSLIQSLNTYPKAVGMSLPYCHPVDTGDEVLDRAMLRYEIYLRHYACELFRMGTPFSFTALGSALVTSVANYKVIGGMTPKKSGEDFYFLQKLRKYGPLLLWNDVHVTPAARFSDRVGFGTGPALIKGRSGDCESYPIYSPDDVQDICDTLCQFDDIYKGMPAKHTRFIQFLQEHRREKDLWTPLLKNCPTSEHFVRACHERFDGLRILQYLKTQQSTDQKADEERLTDFLQRFFPDAPITQEIAGDGLDFECDDLSKLSRIRDTLMSYEYDRRREHDHNLRPNS